MRFTTLLAITALISGAISASIERRDYTNIIADITEIQSHAFNITSKYRHRATNTSIIVIIWAYNDAIALYPKFATAIEHAQDLPPLTEEQSKEIAASIEGLEKQIKVAISSIKPMAHDLMSNILMLNSVFILGLLPRLGSVRHMAVKLGTELTDHWVDVGEYPTEIGAVFADMINTLKVECTQSGLHDCPE